MAIVFVAGGLFFSSAMATATAGYALGKDNIERFREMAHIVWESVWMTFTMGLSATKETLLGTRTNNTSLWRRYQQAWRVLWCKLAETRQKAVEGVQAIQREVRLCAAAVGPPGLIPLQYVLDRQLHHLIAGGIEGALKEAVNQVDIANMDLTLSHFDVGKVPPKLESARVYDLGDDAMAFDYDVTWESQLEATLQVHSSYLPTNLPVTLHDVRFRGPVRVVLAPLTKEYPGFGATLVSFPSMPEIGVDVRVAGGEVTKVVPMVRAEILAALEAGIAQSMIWPQRAVVPSYPLDDPTTPLLSKEELKKLETTDPLLEAEVAMGARPVLRRKLNQMSQLLYCDQCDGQHKELMESIVDLPMPTFRQKKNSKKKGSTTKPQPKAVTTSNLKPKKTTKVVEGVKGGGLLWDRLQHAHQIVVERSHADAAKTHQMLQKTKLWQDVEKVRVQAEEKLKDLHYTSL